MEPTLYLDAFWISPWSFAVYVALKEKGVAFAVEGVALDKGEQRLPRLARALPFGKIPSLVHGDLALAESSAICEYIDETWPAPQHAPLQPAGRDDRARARMLQSWLRTGVDTVRNERSAEVIFYDLPVKPLTEAGQAAAAKLLAVAEAAIPRADGFLFGDRWCLADAELAFCLKRLLRTGTEASAKLAGYAERQWQRASVRGFVEAPRAPFTPYY